MKSRWLIFPLAALALAVSCGAPKTFINEDTDWTFYQKLGVLPFVNYSPDRFAGEKVQSAFITELFMTERFEVVEPGEFNFKAAAEIRAAGGQPGQEISLAMIKAVGEKTGVQGVIEGIVREYTLVRVGQTDYPMISLNMRMIDVPTGTVIWMSSYSMKGGPNLPIVTIGETHTLSELTQKICHKMVSDFVSRAF